MQQHADPEFPESFALAEGDGLYICGTTNGVNRYYDEFPASSRL